MRLCRRRRRAAVLLLLLTFTALIFLATHMTIPTGDDVTAKSDVRYDRSHTGHKVQRSQIIFKDLVNNGAGNRPQTTRANADARESVDFEDKGVEEDEDEDEDDMDAVLELRDADNTTVSNDTASEIFKKSHWMTIHGGGRLGNAMFQYASLVGISSYHGYKTTLQASHSLRRVFKLRSPPAFNSRTGNKSKREKSPGIFDTTLLELSHDTNWTLIGYYQSWRYFGNVSEKIRDEFTFRDKIIKDMIKEAPILANWTRITVGVHVRRGDMASKYERDRGYNVANLGFLKRAMGYFRKKYENPLFLICSDSITWCRDNLKSDDTIFLKGGREVDLATLAHCDHNIVTSGSFGWWGAWLAGGDVVYFKNFPRKNTWLDRQYSKDDYYPPAWVGMD